MFKLYYLFISQVSSSRVLICICLCYLDKLNVLTRSSKLPVSSANDIKQLKQVTRTSGSFDNQQPMKRRSQSLAVDVQPSGPLATSEASNKVQY